MFYDDYGDDYHEGGVEAEVEDEDITLEDIEDALSDWDLYEEVLVDLEGDQDYDMESG